MARYSIDGQILTDIGDALREKNLGEGWLLEQTINCNVGENRQFNVVFSGLAKITIDNVVENTTTTLTRSIFLYDVKNGFKNIGNMDLANPFPQVIETEAKVIQVSLGNWTGSYDIRIEPAYDISIKPEDMSQEIASLNALNINDLKFTGTCSYAFSENNWNFLINKFGESITTDGITQAIGMFKNSTELTNIPFDLNFNDKPNTQSIFDGCNALKSIPNMNVNQVSYYMDSMFKSCYRLTTFPEGFGDNWDWSAITNATSAYDGRMNDMFYGCYSLRSVPRAFLDHINPSISNSYGIYKNGFNNCYNLEKVNNLAVAHKAAWTSNAFSGLFNNCERLKEFTFAKQADGTPYVCKGWKNQLIDLTKVGYGQSAKTYNTDLTDDTMVTDNLDKYLAYVNGTDNPHGHSKSVYWSVFNRKSMVKLIDSLPDVSGSGGTNTVKYMKSQARDVGDEYSMQSLTEEEIAVAAAKGWTLTT